MAAQRATVEIIVATLASQYDARSYFGNRRATIVLPQNDAERLLADIAERAWPPFFSAHAQPHGTEYAVCCAWR